MKLTQRTSTLILLGLLVATTLIVIVANSLNSRVNTYRVVNSFIALGMFGGLMFAYWRGWERARYLTVLGATLLIALIQPQTFISQQVTPLIFLPPILALIVASPIWVVGSAAATLALFELRIDSQSIATEGRTLLFYGTIIGGVLLARLVTDAALQDARANAQRAAHQAEDLARKNDAIHLQGRLLDAVEQAVIATDPQGVVTYCNQYAEVLFGWPAAEMRGRLLSALMPTPAARRQAADALAHVRTGVSWSGELWLAHRRDDHIFPAHMSTSLVYDEAGALLGMVSVVVDISARKQAEDELRRSEAKNRALLDLMPDMLLQLDPGGRLLSVHGAQGRDLSTASGSVIGQPVQHCLPPELAAQIMEHVELALEQRAPQSFEYQLSAQGAGDYEARVVISAEDDVLVIVRDITERKKIDRMKNEFVSVVSHELRTPLTSIQGSLGLIAGGVAGELPAQARMMVDIAFKNSERLVRLINDMLDIEKIESGKTTFALRPQPLLPIVEQAVEINRAYAEQLGVQLTLEAPAADVYVNVDSDRLVQVLTNLLSNAAKFSPAQGAVQITVERRDQRVRVAVVDRGPGIPEAFQSQIFQKFAQADASATRRVGGTGLGLSIAKTIADRLSGQLGFETQPGVGTTFFIDLAVWGEHSAPATSLAPTHARILICEDDQDVAMLLSMMLRQHGYGCDIAGDTVAARDLLRTQRYDGMTLDLLLPGQDGLAFIRELRADEQTRELPVVVVSANADQRRAQLNGDGFGIIDWLTKPIDPARLDAAIAQAVRPAGAAPARILHLEDDPDLRHVIAAMLGPEAELVAAADLHQARQQLAAQRFDLVLLDVSLPDGSGLDLLPWLQQQAGAPTPVIIFSVEEMSNDIARQVAATLVKSRTSNHQLITTIKALVSHPRPRAAIQSTLEV